MFTLACVLRDVQQSSLALFRDRAARQLISDPGKRIFNELLSVVISLFSFFPNGAPICAKIGWYMMVFIGQLLPRRMKFHWGMREHGHFFRLSAGIFPLFEIEVVLFQEVNCGVAI